MNHQKQLQLELEASRLEKDYPTLYLKIPNKQRIYIHSRIKPRAEKKAIEVLPEKIHTIISFGFGLGYQWQPSRLPDNLQNLFIISEDYSFLLKNITLVETVLQRFCNKKMDSDTGLEYLVFSKSSGQGDPFARQNRISKALNLFIFDSDGMADVLAFLLKKTGFDNFLIHYFPPIQKAYAHLGLEIPDIKSQIQILLKKRAQLDFFNKNTKSFFAALWHKNIITNLNIARIKKSSIQFIKSISPLQSACQVFVAGASHNLVTALKNEKVRQAIHDSMIIISTDSAQGILNHFGLYPHIVLSSDASFFNLNQISKWNNPGSQSDSHNMDIHLGNLVINRQLFWRKKTIAFVRTHPLEQLLFEFIGKSYWQAQGSHIGATALELARLLNPERIWVGGVDLCYENGITYGGCTPYTDFFLRSISRIFPYTQAMMAQLSRMGAKKDDTIYRRPSLDKALADLQSWIQKENIYNKVFFLNMPQKICKQYQFNCANVEDLAREKLSKKSSAFKLQLITEALQIGEVTPVEIEQFLREWTAMINQDRLKDAIFAHWDSEKTLSKQRILFFHTLISKNL